MKIGMDVILMNEDVLKFFYEEDRKEKEKLCNYVKQSRGELYVYALISCK